MHGARARAHTHTHTRAITQDQGVINRYGFNSDGAEAVAARLKARSH